MKVEKDRTAHQSEGRWWDTRRMLSICVEEQAALELNPDLKSHGLPKNLSTTMCESVGADVCYFAGL